MVKLRHKGLLVMGITREELSALREGQPLPVPLQDIGLKGQMVLIIPGEDNKQLERIMNDVATAYENGATSIIEIAKSIPKVKLQ